MREEGLFFRVRNVMAGLFDHIEFNGMRLRNRIVRSATWEGMCESDGAPTTRLLDCYVELARGGVGLIITGYAYVRRSEEHTSELQSH